MAVKHLRGAIIEYGVGLLGPIPNVVIFQFNPEQIPRTLNLPRSSAAEAAEQARGREPHQAAAPPVESFQVTAHFSAADDLGNNAPVQRLFGVGPQLVALERMVYPAQGALLGALGEALDKVGAAISGNPPASRATPREQVPRLLFVWGPSRVLPVEIRSMSITEQKYDAFLNPVQAEVQIGMAIASFPAGTDDDVGRGALIYTNVVKDAQSLLNLEKTIRLAADVIPF